MSPPRLLDQTRLDKQMRAGRESRTASAKERAEIEMMDRVERGDEVVGAGLERELFGSRAARLERADAPARQEVGNVLQHRRVGVDAGQA